jgi:hypothetical protein
VGTFLAVISRVLSGSISGLGRPPGYGNKGSDGGCKLLVDGPDGLDSRSDNCFGTVDNHRLPNAKPVLDASG